MITVADYHPHVLICVKQLTGKAVRKVSGRRAPVDWIIGTIGVLAEIGALGEAECRIRTGCPRVR